jgi:hypothetical protein
MAGSSEAPQRHTHAPIEETDLDLFSQTVRSLSDREGKGAYIRVNPVLASLAKKWMGNQALLKEYIVNGQHNVAE